VFFFTIKNGLFPMEKAHFYYLPKASNLFAFINYFLAIPL